MMLRAPHRKLAFSKEAAGIHLAFQTAFNCKVHKCREECDPNGGRDVL